MDFEIIVNSSLIDLGFDLGGGVIENKALLSLVNDFEDSK